MNIKELEKILELLQKIKELQSEVFGTSSDSDSSESEEEITPIEGKGASG